MQPVDLKRKTIFALASIVLFIVSYVVLLLLAVGLTLVCFYLGYHIISFRLSLWPILFGIGLIGMGILVLFFLLKFLVHKTKTDLSGMVEIKERDEPKLFALVYELAKEIKTDKPKKIYLTADINAAVFYDSSFWSMFLPVRKNLQIGLGLVNSVTESELKAILAHEFGHFSQQSMKVGSYVYNVNKIIYNMLYDNDSFQSLMDQFAGVSNVFALFVNIGVNIILGIQWVLKKLYTVVNLSYMQLSREMEFHADEIAAQTAGSQPLIDSLMRLEFVDSTYNDVLAFYNKQIAHNRKTDNLYPQHQSAMRITANYFKLQLVHDLPLITEENNKRFNTSRLVIKDQWASHPTIAERAERLKQLNKSADLSHASAWNYFTQATKLQEKFTDRLFQSVTYAETPSLLSLEEFNEGYTQQFYKYTHDSRYQEVYAHKDITPFDIQEVLSQPERYRIDSLTEIFSEETADLIQQQKGLDKDLETLHQLMSLTHNIKSFDFDGKKYQIKEVASLHEQVKKEKEAIDKRINDIDKKAFAYFYQRAQQQNKQDTLLQLYRDHAALHKTHEDNTALYLDIQSSTAFIQHNTPFVDIRVNFVKVNELEKKLRTNLAVLLKNESAQSLEDQEAKNKAEKYLKQEWVYFKEPSYNDHALGLLFNANDTMWLLSNDALFNKKKELLSYQMSL